MAGSRKGYATGHKATSAPSNNMKAPGGRATNVIGSAGAPKALTGGAQYESPKVKSLPKMHTPDGQKIKGHVAPSVPGLKAY